jgi:ribonuclease Z
MQFLIQSMGGHSNWLLAPEFDFMIDAGEGAASAVGIGRLNACRNIFLTHGHWDHVAGLIQILNLRRRQAEDGTMAVWHPPGPKFDSLKRLVGAGSNWNIYQPGEKIPVAKSIYITPFPVDHRGAAAFGFHCMEKRTRRRKEYSHLSSEQISELVSRHRRSGEKPPEINETYDAHIFAYTGDTSPLSKGLLGNPEILFHDATYLPGMEKEAIQAGHSCLSHALEARKHCGEGLLVGLHLSPRHAHEVPKGGRKVLVPAPRLECLKFSGSREGWQWLEGGRGNALGRENSAEVEKGHRRAVRGPATAACDEMGARAGKFGRVVRGESGVVGLANGRGER